MDQAHAWISWIRKIIYVLPSDGNAAGPLAIVNNNLLAHQQNGRVFKVKADEVTADISNLPINILNACKQGVPRGSCVLAAGSSPELIWDAVFKINEDGENPGILQSIMELLQDEGTGEELQRAVEVSAYHFINCEKGERIKIATVNKKEETQALVKNFSEDLSLAVLSERVQNANPNIRTAGEVLIRVISYVKGRKDGRMQVNLLLLTGGVNNYPRTAMEFLQVIKSEDQIMYNTLCGNNSIKDKTDTIFAALKLYWHLELIYFVDGSLPNPLASLKYYFKVVEEIEGPVPSSS